MAELTKVETKKPDVAKITVTFTAAEALDLARGYKNYYGASTVTKLIEDAVSGKTTPAPKTFTDYMLASANRATF